MTLTKANDSMTAFKDGKPKPGIYNFQNVFDQA